MNKILTDDMIPALKGKLPSLYTIEIENNTAGGLYAFRIGALWFIVGNTILNAATKEIALPFRQIMLTGVATSWGQASSDKVGRIFGLNDFTLRLDFPDAVTFASLTAIAIYAE